MVAWIIVLNFQRFSRLEIYEECDVLIPYIVEASQWETSSWQFYDQNVLPLLSGFGSVPAIKWDRSAVNNEGKPRKTHWMPKVRHRTHRQIHQTETSIKKVELCWWLSQRLNRKTANVYLYYLLFVCYMKKYSYIVWYCPFHWDIFASVPSFNGHQHRVAGVLQPVGIVDPGSRRNSLWWSLVATKGRWLVATRALKLTTFWGSELKGKMMMMIMDVDDDIDNDHWIIWSFDDNVPGIIWFSSTKGSTITSIHSTKRSHRRFVLGVLVVLSGVNCWYQLKNCQRSPWHPRLHGGGWSTESLKFSWSFSYVRFWGWRKFDLSSNMRNIF